ANLSKTHGPLMTLHLGYLTTLVVSSAEMAREVLQKNDHTFSGRIVIDAACTLSHHEGSMVFGQLGPHWRTLRRICNTQMFNP
ncbi:cytochrome P450, partial [Mycobacterium kansasii]